MTYFKTLFASLTIVLILVGCKAEKVEISISQNDIEEAIKTANTDLPFEATFSVLGELDDDQKAEFDAIETVLANYISIDEFEIDKGDFGIDLTIEGSIPLTSQAKIDSAYAVSITPYGADAELYLVQVVTGAKFDKMSRELKSINFMLSPDAFHPTKFKLKGNGMRVIAPAASVDNEPHLLYEGVVEGRLTLSFNGGVFEETGAGFFVGKLAK